jgi:hypothetical protein
VATREQRELKASVMEGHVDLHPDTVICKKDGRVEFRFGFFYTHGRTSEKEAASVSRAIRGSGWRVVDHQQVWRQWPADSYFQVIVEREA